MGGHLARGISPRARPTMAREQRRCWARLKMRSEAIRARSTRRTTRFRAVHPAKSRAGRLAGLREAARRGTNLAQSYWATWWLDAGQGAAKGSRLGGRSAAISFPYFSRWPPRFPRFIHPLKVDDQDRDRLPIRCHFRLLDRQGSTWIATRRDYIYTHHSAADALEAQKPDVIAQNATLMALAAFWIADRPERFAAPLSL